jgi:hypothetical protein
VAVQGTFLPWMWLNSKCEYEEVTNHRPISGMQVSLSSQSLIFGIPLPGPIYTLSDKMGSQLESTDAQNKLEDLSGIVVQPGENPYDALIRACRGDPVSHPPPSYISFPN